MKYIFSLLTTLSFLTALAQPWHNGQSFTLYKGGPVMEFKPDVGAVWVPTKACGLPSGAICNTNYHIYEFVCFENTNIVHTQGVTYAKCNSGEQKTIGFAEKISVTTANVYDATITERRRVESYWWYRASVVNKYNVQQCGYLDYLGSFAVKVVEPVTLNSLDDIRNICKDHAPINLRTYLSDQTRGTIMVDGKELINGTLDPSTLTGGIHTIYVTHQYSNGWFQSPSQTINIIIPPAVNAGDDIALCKDYGKYYLAGTPGGGTWSGETLDNNNIFETQKFAPGTYKLKYSKTDQYGCVATDILQIRVNDLPTVTNLIPPTFCVMDKQYDLTKITPTGTVTSVWRGAGIIDNYLFLAGLAGDGDWNISLEVTDKATGCKNAASKIVTVKTNPDLMMGPIVEICEGSEPIKISGDYPAGGTYTGTGVDRVAGTFNPVGLQANRMYSVNYKVTVNGCSSENERDIYINALPQLEVKTKTISVCPESDVLLIDNVKPSGGQYINQFLISENVFSVTNAKQGIHEITYLYEDQNDCASTTKFNVSIVPKVVVDAGPDFQTCENDPPVKISGQYPEGGAWTATCGNCSAGDYFIPEIAGVGTYVLTYKMSYSANCTGMDSRKVTVKPNPIINTSEIVNVCRNDAPVSLNNYVSPEGGKWVVTSFLRNNIFYPGEAKSGFNQVKYSYTDSTNGCSTTESMKVNVNSFPVVEAGPNIFTCTNTNPIELTGEPIDGIWYGLGVNGKIFDPKRANKGANNLYLKKTNALGCTGIDSLIAMVYELPTVDAGTDLKICKNAQPINLFGSPSGGSWTGSDAVDQNNYFDPGSSSSNQTTLTYTYFDPNGCWAVDKKIVTILPTPRVSVSESNSVCESILKYSPKGGTPIGGTWEGIGVVDKVFIPSQTGIGSHPIYYVFTDINKCTDSALAYVEVLSSPVVKAGFDTTICKSAETFDLSKFSASPKGGIWKGSNVVNSILSVAGTTPGRYTLYYSFTDKNKCGSTDSVDFDIEEGLEMPVISGENRLCLGDTVNLEATIPNENVDTKYFWRKQGETETFTEGKRIQFINEKSITIFAEAINPQKKCASKRGKMDMINDTPVGIITASKASIEKDGYVKFTFSGNGKNYKWEFGDGDYSTETSPYHYYYQSGTYSLNVQVTSEKGCKATFQASDIIKVTGKDVVIVTSIPNSKIEDINIKGYPNPVSDLYNIELPSGEYTITITDLSGKVKDSIIFSNSGAIDFSQYPIGTYILQLQSDEITKSLKVQKY